MILSLSNVKCNLSLSPRRCPPPPNHVAAVLAPVQVVAPASAGDLADSGRGMLSSFFSPKRTHTVINIANVMPGLVLCTVCVLLMSYLTFRRERPEGKIAF